MLFQFVSFLFLGGCIYSYYNPIYILYILNSIYCSYNSFKQIFISNAYKTEPIININDKNDTIVCNYSFRNKEYTIITSKQNFNIQPYTTKEIDDVQKATSLTLETNTPDDIICANIILKDNTSLDFTTNIKKMSGPLGNFYKGTSNELTQYGLRLYIENFYYNNVESVYIMKSDGTEYNLLESLSN